eukprot:3675295-Pyramimonas_sp.AAC.1
MAWQAPHRYDLVICSQVVEHVDDAAAFVRKLLRIGRTVIVSVPYNWPRCTACRHRYHRITKKLFRSWAGTAQAAAELVVKEREGGKFDSRLISIYINKT